MNVEFLVENLIPYLSLLTKIVPAHAQVPVLSNLLLTADEKGFNLSATDLEIGVKVTIPAKVITPGKITIPGKQFAEVINSLSKDKVVIELKGQTIHVTSRKNTFEFQTIDSTEFPDLFQEKGELISTFTPAELKKIFSKLLFAVSVDEARPTLTGIYMAQLDESVDFVATDGFRLSLESLPKKKMFDGEGLIVSARLIQEVLSFKSKESVSFFVHTENNQVLFETSEVVLVGRLIEGTYPPYQRVILQNPKTTVTLDLEEFQQAVKLAAVFARESSNVVKLSIEKNMLSLSSKSSGVGSGDAKLSITQKGEDNEISFNVKYLIDLLRNIDDRELTMEISSSSEPAVFKGIKDSHFLHVIMPVKVES